MGTPPLKPGAQMQMIEEAEIADRRLISRPNACTAERLSGILAYRGGDPCFLTPDGRAFKLAERAPKGLIGAPVSATMVAPVGSRPRAYDVARVVAD